MHGEFLLRVKLKFLSFNLGEAVVRKRTKQTAKSVLQCINWPEDDAGIPFCYKLILEHKLLIILAKIQSNTKFIIFLHLVSFMEEYI